MDSVVYQKWFPSVFVAGVQSRAREPVILTVDNCGAHTELTHPQIQIFALPPNVTAIHQPLDAGVVAALKHPYKKRFISLVIRAHEDKLQKEAAASATEHDASFADVAAQWIYHQVPYSRITSMRTRVKACLSRHLVPDAG